MNGAGNRIKSRAFTLIELLLVVTIIIILISMLMVGFRSVNTTLKEKSCQNNLSKIGAILDQYCQRNRGYYPDMYGYSTMFERWQNLGTGIPPTGPVMTQWTALSNVRQLKEMGATDNLFTCPFSVTPANPSSLGIGTFDTPVLDTITAGGNVFRVHFTSYNPLFCRGCNINNLLWPVNPEALHTATSFELDKYADGRLSPITNACKGNTPLVADLLVWSPNFSNGLNVGCGWFHGGGIVTGPGQDPVLYYAYSVGPVDQALSPGFNNSACNTLFAGGYVAHSEPSEFQNPDGTLNTTAASIPMITGGIPYYNWFALQPSAN